MFKFCVLVVLCLALVVEADPFKKRQCRYAETGLQACIKAGFELTQFECAVEKLNVKTFRKMKCAKKEVYLAKNCIPHGYEMSCFVPAPEPLPVIYEISTHTGSVRNAQTGNGILIKLFGEGEETDSISITKGGDRQGWGSTDEYTVRAALIEELTSLTLTTDGTDGWCYDSVTVKCASCGWSCTATFAACQWLDDKETNALKDFNCKAASESVNECAEGLPADKQAEYRGHKAVTVSGIECQDWAAQEPHKHGALTSYPNAGLDFNFCRNPDGEPAAWCYTTDSTKRWEVCGIPDCPPSVSYEITTKTGDIVNAQTNARITMQLFGEGTNRTSPIIANIVGHDDRIRGRTDEYIVLRRPLAQLTSLNLTTDGNDGWCYDSVTVKCASCGWSCTATFAPCQWLDDKETNALSDFTCEDASEPVTYEISTHTGNVVNAQTGNGILIKLFGEGEETDSISITKDGDRQREGTDVYTVPAAPIEVLTEITLTIDGTDGWCYDSVTVKCASCGWSCTATFAACQWLDDKETNALKDFNCKAASVLE